MAYNLILFTCLYAFIMYFLNVSYMFLYVVCFSYNVFSILFYMFSMFSYICIYISYMIIVFKYFSYNFLFLYISILSNNEKIHLNSKLVTLILVFFGLVLALSNQGLNYITYNSNCGNESILDTTLLYHDLITPHLIFLITILIVALFCVVKMTEGFKGSLIKNVDG